MPVDLSSYGQFGRYQLIRRISLGGMAEVFKAKSFNEFGFEKVVALKRLLPSVAQEQGFVEMLIQEAQIAARLDHHNICRIYEFGKVDDAYYLTMEFIYGHDLRQALRVLKERDETMDPILAAWLGLRVAEALDYAWTRAEHDELPLELVHRDISPQNVMIGFDGRIKVIDFGIAKFANQTVQTAAGVLKGKYAYMSPEHAERQELDARSDVWSLGVVLHELLAARRLFTGISMADVIDQVLSREIPRLDHIDDEMADIIDRMLARDVDERFDSHRAVIKALHGYLARAPNPITGHDMGQWMDRLFPEEQRIEADLTDQEVRLIFSAEERGEDTTDQRSDVSQATQIFFMDETGQGDYKEVLQALIDRGRVHTVHTKVQGKDMPVRRRKSHSARRSDARAVLWDAFWATFVFVGVTVLLLSL